MEGDTKLSWASAVSSSSPSVNGESIQNTQESVPAESSQKFSDKKFTPAPAPKTNVWKARQEQMVKLSNCQPKDSGESKVASKVDGSSAKASLNGNLNHKNSELISILSDTESWPTLNKAVSEEISHEKEKPNPPVARTSGKEKWVTYIPTITHSKPLPLKSGNRSREGRFHDNAFRGSAKNGRIASTDDSHTLSKNHREHKSDKGRNNRRGANNQEKRESKNTVQANASKDKNVSNVSSQTANYPKENASNTKDTNGISNKLNIEELKIKDNTNGVKEDSNRHQRNNSYRVRGSLHIPFIHQNGQPLLNVGAFVQTPNIYMPFRPPACGNLSIPFYPNEKYQQPYMYDYSHMNHLGMMVPVMYDPIVLKNYILGQIDYYFSVENLCKDLFLRRHMDDQGWVNLLVLANFNRIRSFALEYNFIRDVTTYSRTVDVIFSDGYDRVRKKEGWEIWVLPEKERDPSVRNGRSTSTNFPDNEKPNITSKALKESVDALPFLPRINPGAAPFAPKSQEIPSNGSGVNMYNQNSLSKTPSSNVVVPEEVSSIDKTEKEGQNSIKDDK
ncbi:unnamed protein product [Pneumocystis jirovecii]|uniref:HTH La-type RNA-binding domain-containing protein n=2 Tax=Pneumocystis jirovecii TaxID=42068 RepID=L0PEA8_PNEJI|nr:uncharacterized protein T551_03085 [Pneumocystis jirovecii RU7]KTW27586.1 hypothetical protein T551_03085 [Pneumocystis jirovecii RU7]CCJ30394.1 unnamed protein product [Pneumocystis jirovecii]